MMRKIAVIFLSILFGTSLFPAFSKTPEKLPRAYEGSMMPYDFSATDSVAAYPDSLQPVGVLYVARHGARYLTGPKKISNLQKLLYEAGMRRHLTREGERFMALLGEVEKATDGQWGELSPVGIAEERTLGADMQRRYGKLLRNARVEGSSTFVPRAMMTMYEFMHALEMPEHSMRIYTNSGKQNDSLLYCFDTFTDYRDYREDTGAWAPYYEDFVEKNVPVEPARRILGMEGENNKPRLRALTMEIYGVLQSLRAMGLPDRAAEFMTEDEYRACWEASNLRHWLRNTVTPWSSVCATATRPLIERLVEDGDRMLSVSEEEDAAGGAAPLRFCGYYGHAETLLPLLSAMRIPGCYADTEDTEELASLWKLQEITPLGANFEVILLRGESGASYAALRLNGRNIAPREGDDAMFAPWPELSADWLADPGQN